MTTAERKQAGGAGLPRWILVILATMFLATAGFYAYCCVFSQFNFPDDQGFLMVTVRGYLEGHPLYDSVGVIYGPVYYLWEWIFHRMTSLPVTHDVTYGLCVFHWLAAASILGLAGGRMTRSAPMGFFVFMQATVHLASMARLPGHPQEVIAVLLALAVLVAGGRFRRGWTLGLLGGLGAALFLTKINVGAFYVMALFWVVFCHTSFFQSRRRWFWGVLIAGSLLPFLLLRPRLGEPWVRDLGLETWFSMLAAGAIAFRFVGRPKMGFADWSGAALGFCATSGITLAILLVSGSSLSAIFDALVTFSSRLADESPSLPLLVSGSVWVAAAGLLCAAAAFTLKDRLGSLSLRIAVWKGLYGLLGGLFFAMAPQMKLGYLMPWSWLVLVGVPRDEHSVRAGAFARVFLCFTVCWQALQTYPLAGDEHAGVATIPAIMIFTLCLHDALRVFAAETRAGRRLSSLPHRTGVLLNALVLVGSLCVFADAWCPPGRCWRWFSSGTALDLPGAHRLRLPRERAEAYRAMTHYLERECDTFFTVPGLTSLYFWTGKPLPEYCRVPGFGFLDDDRQQAAVLTALKQARRPLIVINEESLASVAGKGVIKKRPLSSVIKDGPLRRYIAEEFQEAKRFRWVLILAPKDTVDQAQPIKGVVH